MAQADSIPSSSRQLITGESVSMRISLVDARPEPSSKGCWNFRMFLGRGTKLFNS